MSLEYSSKNEIGLWAIPIHVNESNKQVAAFDFCKNNGIIGIGWETSKTIVGLNSNYQDIFDNYSNFIGNPKLKTFIQYVERFNEIKKDDLIWTRSGNNYYLCRFTGEKIDYFRDNLSYNEIIEHEKYDIWHGLKCEILNVGTSDMVTGTVQDIFCAGGIRRFRKNLEETRIFSMNMYNKLTNSNYYKINKGLLSNISNLRFEDLEELVILYLQYKYNYGVFTNTCKKNTKTYECVLFDKSNFEKIFVQVKNGKINLNDADYKNIYLDNKFYFFSNIEEYSGNYSNENIIIINKEDLEIFINENSSLQDKYNYIN